jgi:chromosome segregation ATPase
LSATDALYNEIAALEAEKAEAEQRFELADQTAGEYMAEIARLRAELAAAKEENVELRDWLERLGVLASGGQIDNAPPEEET